MEGDKLLHKDLTYKLRGFLFGVHNELGRFCNERQYADAFEHVLQENDIIYSREYIPPPSFSGERFGRNRVDFLVEKCVVIELKVVRFLNKEHYFQCQRYLSALDLDLALLVNFRPKFLKVQRVLNHQKIKVNLV